MRLALLAASFLLAGPLPVYAQSVEMRWTKVAKAELDTFQASAGSVRINNVIVERRNGVDPAGPATEHEFSASVANRGGDPMRIVVQIVGLAADGTPTLSSESLVDVEPRRNEQIRQSFRASADAMAATTSLWLHASAAPP